MHILFYLSTNICFHMLLISNLYYTFVLFGALQLGHFSFLIDFWVKKCCFAFNSLANYVRVVYWCLYPCRDALYFRFITSWNDFEETIKVTNWANIILIFQRVFLPTVPYVLPLVQMALMSSVYCTVVLSLERYLRLCKVQAMSKKVNVEIRKIWLGDLNIW